MKLHLSTKKKERKREYSQQTIRQPSNSPQFHPQSHLSGTPALGISRVVAEAAYLLLTCLPVSDLPSQPREGGNLRHPGTFGVMACGLFPGAEDHSVVAASAGVGSWAPPGSQAGQAGCGRSWGPGLGSSPAPPESSAQCGRQMAALHCLRPGLPKEGCQVDLWPGVWLGDLPYSSTSLGTLGGLVDGVTSEISTLSDRWTTVGSGLCPARSSLTWDSRPWGNRAWPPAHAHLCRYTGWKGTAEPGGKAPRPRSHCLASKPSATDWVSNFISEFPSLKGEP